MIKPLAERLVRIARSSRHGIHWKKAVHTIPVLKPFYKVIAQAAIDHQYPLTFNIEPTSSCNLTCKMCPTHISKKANGFISRELFKKIVDESKQYPRPRHFVLHKDGESLLHGDIGWMVEYIKEANPDHSVYLSTNGTPLTEKKARQLIAADLDQLHVSVNAFNPETFKTVRGGDLNLVVENTLRLLELKKELQAEKPVVTVQIIEMEETVDEIDDFVEKWKQHDVEISIPHFLTWGGEYTDKTQEKYNHRTVRHPCHSLWHAPSINWDGLVSICCQDWNEDETIGDLNTQTLAEVWTGDKLRRYRELHLSGKWNDVPLCKECNYWAYNPNMFFPWQKK